MMKCMHAVFLGNFANGIIVKVLRLLTSATQYKVLCNLLKKNQPDLIFLDITMPDEDGFELLKYFYKINFEIIFTTAHKEYAIKAIRNSALDYLVKPVNMEDFKLAITRYESKKQVKISIDRFKLLTENISSQSIDKQRIVFPTKNGFEVVQSDSIVYCKSDGSYTSIFTTEREYLITKSLKDISKSLIEPQFIRIHKSYLVNRNYIKGFKSDEFNIEMISGETIPVSETFFTKKKLIDAITN